LRKEHPILRLSALKGAKVTLDGGASTALIDLVIDLAAGDYPSVIHVLIADEDGTRRALPPPNRIDAHGVRVAAAARGAVVTEDALARMVLLRRDVMDALVVDLKDLRIVRVNDLLLQSVGDGWALTAADISPWAVVRRLTRGLIGRDVADDVLDWQQVEFLRGDPHAAAADRDYHRRVARLQPTQIARLTDGLPYMHAAELLTILPDPLAADVLEAMLPERQAQVITELGSGQAARLIAEMATDQAADLLGHLELDEATNLLDAVPPERARLIADLLRFPADSAGGIMTNEVVIAPVAGTVAEVLQHIRPALARPDFVYFVYLVDDEQARHLRGVVTLRDLNLADPETPVEQIMRADLLTVGALESALDTAHAVSDHALNALPVVAPDGALLGIVTLDKAMAQILPEAWRDRMPRVFS
jgi:magnesium transporter